MRIDHGDVRVAVSDEPADCVITAERAVCDDVVSGQYPVEFPTACSPQAWSTGAPLLYLRTMLGLEPHGDHLVVEPALPVGFGRIELLDIPGRWGRADAFGRGLVEVGSSADGGSPTPPAIQVRGNHAFPRA